MFTQNFNKKILGVVLATVFTVNFTNAEANVNISNKLSFDIGGAVSEFVKSTKEAVTSVFEEKKEDIFSVEVESEKKNSEKNEVLSKKDLNVCEVYDATILNTLDLDLASTKAVEKIGKIEDRLEDETQLRLEIFEKNKKLTELEKKEKIVFREMRKELEDARSYYKKIDEVVIDTGEFLETIDCENLNKKDINNLSNSYQKTDELLIEETIFRKTFSSSLKDKMSILQSGVKEIGK